MTNRRHNFCLLVPMLAAVLAAAPVARAQYRMDLPPDGPMVTPANPTITPHPNAQVPLDLDFTDSDGRKVKLADEFNQGRPVVMMMVYFSCPAMCGLNQDTLGRAVREGPRGLVLGKDYDVVIVSIDPDDTPAIAATKRENYLKFMGLPASQSGFTYLTGTETNIRTLADAIGFGYYRNPPAKAGGPTDKYAHSLGTFVMTPYGRLSKLLPNLDYTNDELHAALVAAADGKIGSVVDKILTGCGAMRLNPNTGKYEQNPWFWAGTAGGLASMAFMAIFLTVMWRGEYKKSRAQKSEAPESPPDPEFEPSP